MKLIGLRSFRRKAELLAVLAAPTRQDTAAECLGAVPKIHWGALARVSPAASTCGALSGAGGTGARRSPSPPRLIVAHRPPTRHRGGEGGGVTEGEGGR